MSFSWKSYFLGLGSGIVFACVIFFIAYNLTYKNDKYDSQIEQPEDFDAEETDFDVLEEDSAPEGIAEEEEISEEEAAEEEEIPEEEYTEDEYSEEEYSEEEYSEEEYSDEEIDDSQEGEEETSDQTANAVDQMFKDVFIPDGYYAQQISEMLKENGIIENAVDFNKYIINKNKQAKLKKGKYTLPVGGDYETLLKILTGKK